MAKRKERTAKPMEQAATGDEQEHPAEAARLPLVVGIGASAGGLDSLTRLLNRVPNDTGLAFVVVQHLAPTHESLLPELLARETKMPVEAIGQGAPVKPNHVYVIPPSVTVEIQGGALSLTPRPPRGHTVPVDIFMRSLAEDTSVRPIGVILSGTGSDGALGIQAIKAEGGITFAESDVTAKYPGMPRNAISTGSVDFVLPVDELADELAQIGRRLLQAPPPPEDGRTDLGSPEDLKKIFALLRSRRDVDFTYYRQTTIKRRILRRMVLHKLHNLKDYVRLLQDRPNELQELYQDVLIKVTHFFRDPQVFEVLKTVVFPEMIKRREADAPIRIWVPGCSTGEEAYSLAICLFEVLDELKVNASISLFATDISDLAIERARAGVYVENIAMDVSADRLRRFFARVDNHYQISKAIRDVCIFAKQDVTRDPPFSKIDLISCRNVLIYLEPILQKRVVPMFHYALKPGGFLVLGTSETIGSSADLFSVVDRQAKIYAKTSASARATIDFGAGPYTVADTGRERAAAKAASAVWEVLDVQREADRVVLSRFAPPGVIVNDALQILQFRGKTGAYLEPAPGEASLNLLKMAREGLMLELRAALQDAKKNGTTTRSRETRVRANGGFRNVVVEVIPLKHAGRNDAAPTPRCYLVLFEEPETSPPAKEKETKKPSADKGDGSGGVRADKLEQELSATREYLQSIIEEQEATNEELQSANEEILSSNEELQSINEELETAKEELQSTNEELTTLNEELANRNEELSHVNNDLTNLLASVNLPIVMLSSDLRVRRITPTAEKALNVITGDVGRHIGDIKLKLDVPDLEQLIAEVIETVSIREREVQDRDGHWYQMRIRPYRTLENKIDGAVLVFVDIDGLKRSA